MRSAACAMTSPDAAVPPAADESGAGRPVWRRRWVRITFFSLLTVALLAEAVVAAPYVAKGAEAVTDADLRWLGLAVVFELMSMRAFARMRRRMLAAGGLVLPLRRVESLTYTAYAVGASLPGGSAISSGYLFKRLRGWGATLPAAGFTVLTSSLLSVAAFSALAVVTAAATGRGGIEAVGGRRPCSGWSRRWPWRCGTAPVRRSRSTTPSPAACAA